MLGSGRLPHPAARTRPLLLVGLLSLASAACDRPVGAELPPLRPARAAGPLTVHPTNPRYFTDGGGRAILLAGAHTWSNLQDNGGTDPPPRFDYARYLDFLAEHNHNFFRLWSWEQAAWTAETDGDYRFDPLPFRRTGPGLALDGRPKFDVTAFDPAYFDRLRERVAAAGERGIYVAVVLFNGWSVEDKDLGLGNPWRGHPFHRDNNVNGIDGDPDGDGEGTEVHTLRVPAVTAVQEAYVRRVVDALNDLDNVLYEISNESFQGSERWQYHMIRVIREHEAGLPKRHPVGMTVEYRNGSNADLFASPADWISPNGSVADPPPADGSKVVIEDTDHLCGICGDASWVWKSFVRGRNPVFMDPYDGAAYGVGAPTGFAPADPRWVGIRRNLGYVLSYATRVDLAAMAPRGELCSTGYCLAGPDGAPVEYLVFLPDGGRARVDLSGTPGALAVEWFSPASGRRFAADSVQGGAMRRFSPPFRGPAVLYLRAGAEDPAARPIARP